MKTSFLSKVFCVATCLASTMLAQAGTTLCPANITTGVTGSVACEYSVGSTQDFLNTDPLSVNADAFFGFSDWAFGGKIGIDTGYTGIGTGLSGTWSIPALADSDIMLIFKSGNGTTIVGYLLADDVFSGSWESPFENPPFTTIPNTKNVSHISVYLRDETPRETRRVPEPAPLALLALGLMVAVAVRARLR